MTISQWRRFLQRWSDNWLARDEKFPRQVRERRWLGSQPATDEQISQLEKRLGYRLPPSYRNFLLTTNGWLRTSFCIARIRPVSEVDWLESDTPELLDGSSPEEGGDLMQDYPSEEYFSYDGRPIFDCEHFRGSLVIADPIPGDSMIYVLNPFVVARDGEWEAWRVAHWIPGRALEHCRPSRAAIIQLHTRSRGSHPWLCPTALPGLPGLRHVTGVTVRRIPTKSQENTTYDDEVTGLNRLPASSVKSGFCAATLFYVAPRFVPLSQQAVFG